MLPFLAALVSPLTSVFSSVVGYFQHRNDMKEATRQAELAIQKTKVELAGQATNSEQLIALQNLQQPLSDATFRRVLICVIALPLALLVPDLFGYPRFGSDIVAQYFGLVQKLIPETYQLFLTSMVAAYFGIVKVKETFFSK